MTKVKICGITNKHDGLLAAEAGADLLGFVFYPPSSRAVTPKIVAPIAAAIRRSYPLVTLVGVFVDTAASSVAQVADECGLDCVQLHGEEPPAAVDDLITVGLGVIKGFRVRDGAGLARMAGYRSTYHLLDTYVPDRPGGTGAVFDWRIARTAAGATPVILAGGLTSQNVGQAVRIATPWGVDVSSGVEATPGRKDGEKVRAFIMAAKNALAQEESV